MIRYQDDLAGVLPEQLSGFCVGWKNPLQPDQLYRVLQNSAYVELAVDEDSGQVAGFVNALSDCIMAAYIPLLEVRPEYQGQGIGTRLLQEMLQQTKHLHMVDLLCDPPLQAYYERVGMHPATGMMVRRWHPYQF